MRKSTGNAIELMRMTLYVFFPVGIFYYFNVPQYFEKYVSDKRKILNPEGNHPPLTMEENEKLRLKLKEEKRVKSQRTINS